jgi:hypothetical protein
MNSNFLFGKRGTLLTKSSKLRTKLVPLALIIGVVLLGLVAKAEGNSAATGSSNNSNSAASNNQSSSANGAGSTGGTSEGSSSSSNNSLNIDLKSQSNSVNGQTNSSASLKVNGQSQHVEDPTNIHKSYTSDDGNSTVNINVQNHSSSSGGGM